MKIKLENLAKILGNKDFARVEVTMKSPHAWATGGMFSCKEEKYRLVTELLYIDGRTVNDGDAMITKRGIFYPFSKIYDGIPDGIKFLRLVYLERIREVIVKNK
jgi:hypothetical protein